MPPLRQRFGLCFIKDLLQYDKTITPKSELFSLPMVGLQLPTLDDSFVEASVGQLGEPLPCFQVRGWEEEC